jgi:hypothetical protein
MSDATPPRALLQHKPWYQYVVFAAAIVSSLGAIVKIMEWLHIVPEQFAGLFRIISNTIRPAVPYIPPVLLFAIAYWQRTRLLRWARKLCRDLSNGYVQLLKLLLRPILRQLHAEIEAATSDGSPFEVKYGQLEFVMPAGQAQRNERFVFDKPFREVPNIYITECTAGDWLLAKIDAKDTESFAWAARRSVFPQPTGPYGVRLQWVAIAPKFSRKDSGTGQLVIHNALYGAGGFSAVLTSQLRAKIRHDALSETCGNHLAGDPLRGTLKFLTIEYTFRGQRRSVTISENQPITLP